MTNGFHSVIVYANDTFGNIGASQIINFTVAVPEPLPVIPVVVASVIAVVVTTAGLLVYFRRRRGKP